LLRCFVVSRPTTGARRGRVRVVRGKSDLTGEMILPSFQKYDESRQQPYAAFVDRLTRFLEQDDALLIVAGFSFGDEHINNLIFGALENRPRTHVYALQFEEHSEDSILIKRAYQRSNLIVVGPKTGVIGGRRAKWAPSETPAFMDVVFELQETAAAPGAPETSKTGLMKIGDFARFCHSATLHTSVRSRPSRARSFVYACARTCRRLSS
jgi:hypothetical protein